MQSTSKEEDSTKEDDDDKPPVEIDDEGFKIPQVITHHTKKKMDAEGHKKVVSCILGRDLDPSGHFIYMVKIRHELKPYGLNKHEWRCYLTHLMNTEPTITEVELLRDREKNPLEPQTFKALKMYLQLIKQERYKITFLVECFPASTMKRKVERSGPQTRHLNIRTEGHPISLHERWVSKRTENILRQGRETES